MDAIVYDKVGKEAEKVRDALYGIYPQETITDAAIASFDDGADGIPVKALTVGIEPVQDLHRYDNPWPGGGGKNLFDKDNVTKLNAYIDGSIQSSSGQRMVYIPCKPNTTYTAQKIAVAGDTADRFAFAYTTTAPAIGVTVYEQIVRPTPTTIGQKLSLTITTGADAQYLVLWISQSEGYDASLLTTMIAEESSASAYAPYSNICPISGWTGAEINDTGINVWDEEWELGSIDSSTGANTGGSDSIRTKGYIPVAPQTNYYVKNPVGPTVIVCTYDKNKQFVKNISYNVGNRVVTTSDDRIRYMRVAYTGYGNTYNNDLSINYPSTDTEYHPYTGSKISVTFPSEAGTVYGGTLTINPDRTGTLVVDGVKKTTTWGDGDTSGAITALHRKAYYPHVLTGHQLDMSKKTICLCNVAHIVNQVDIVGFYPYASTQFYLTMPADTLDATAVEFFFPIDDPFEITLTESEISGILTTLYGTNNIWASTGNIAKLTYRADLGKYIDSHITTAVANALNA